MNNEVIRAILNRRSTRRYLPDSLTQEELDVILNAGLQAPSARNLQPNYIRVIRDRDTLLEMDADYKKLIEEGAPAYTGFQEQPFFHDAPTLILLFGDRDNDYSAIDAGILVENMALAAEGMDIGTCIIGCIKALFRAPAGEKWEKRLHVPERCRFTISIIAGHKAEHPESTPRDASRIELL